MTAGTVDGAEREIVLAEYRALRDEIGRIAGQRAVFRVVAFTLTSVAIGVGVERVSAVLLLLAPIAVLLGDLMIVVVLTGVAVTLGWLALPFFAGRTLAIVTGVTVVDGVLLVVFLSSYVRHRTAS
jgi:hypothetical protein